MLILTRRRGEEVLIGQEIRVTVLNVDGDYVKIGISAPREVRVLRHELLDAVRTQNQRSTVAPESWPGTPPGFSPAVATSSPEEEAPEQPGE